MIQPIKDLLTRSIHNPTNAIKEKDEQEHQQSSSLNSMTRKSNQILSHKQQESLLTEKKIK